MVQPEMKEKLIEVTTIEKPVEKKKLLTREERMVESIKSALEKGYPDKEVRFKALELIMDELTESSKGEGETFKAYNQVFDELKKELKK